MVKRFYEVGWQSDDLSILDNIIAEDHIQVWHVLLCVQAARLALGQISALCLQEDQVWQSSPRLGRDSVKRGITFIRKYYPDVR